MSVSEFQPLTRGAIGKLIRGRSLRGSDQSGHRRRQMPRWPFSGQVEMWLPNGDGGEELALASCENLGVGGVGVRCDEPLELGLEIPITVHQPEASFHGRAVVRHCTKLRDGFYTGLEFIFGKH